MVKREKERKKTKEKKILTFEKIKKDTFEKRINAVFNDKRLSPKQKRILKRYNNYKLSEAVKDATRLTYAEYLKLFFIAIKKDPKKITKKDLEKYFISISKQAATSIRNNRLILLYFFRWLYNSKHPNIIKDWKFKKNNNFKLPEELLTPKEIAKMVQVANTIRDKAIIFTLYESACRKGEFLGLKLKHITLDKYGATLRVEGKTGARRIRLINSVADLLKWLNTHPYADNPEAPLWLNLGAWKGEGGRAFGEDGLKRLLKIIGQRAKIKKKIYPHLLRHSRLTELAKLGFKEAELKIFAGWSSASRMPSVYIHLSGADVDKKLLEMEGVLEEKESEEERRKKEVLRPKFCPRCKVKNSATARFCESCSMALDLKTAVEVEEKTKKYDEKLKKLLDLWVDKNREEAEKLAKEVGII